MALAEWLWQTARLKPSAPALLKGAVVEADYGGFAGQAASLATALITRHGIGPGDRIGLLMTNHLAYLPVMYGVWLAGGVVVPINAKLHAREAAWILENSGARLAFVTAKPGDDLRALPDLPRSLAEIVDVDGPAFAALLTADPIAAPRIRAPDDLAWLFYTSGTTGRPKGVMISHGNLITMALAYQSDVDGVTAQDAALYAAPFSHGAGLYNLMHVLRGARHVVPESGGFEPDEILGLCPRLTNVSMFAAPTMVRRLVAAAEASDRRGDGLRSCVYGGGPMYVADIRHAVEVMGPRFIQIYGQGESPMTISVLPRELVADRSHPRWQQRLGSVGHAHAPVQIRITDDQDRPLPPGETGEIQVRGPSVMLGYWNNQEATAETLRGGWLHTGDVGSLDQDGFLTLTDRSKDVIISGGTNIYPREIEEVLLEDPSVAEVAVIGAPDPEWGEVVVAFCVAETGHRIDRAALDARCLARIARFKRPKAYHAVPSLPKNNYGKVLKTELRAWLDAPDSPPGPP